MNKNLYPHPFFAREGWPFIGAAALVALIMQLTVGGWIAAVFWIIAIFVLQFFRDPVRELPSNPDALCSPVDGRVIRVEETTCPYTGEYCRMVSIFMNVFNVHSQKSPVAGTVEKIEYFPGKFVNADLDKASSENERNAVTIRTDRGDRVCFVQVAGLVARRILCYTSVDARIERGERYGFIRFGSRVDMYFPLSYRVSVSIGDVVHGRTDTIAIAPEESAQ